MSELHYGIKQPLRFYEKLEHQNRFKEQANDSVFKLLCPLGWVLPFQIRRAVGLLPITSVKLVNTATGASTEIFNNIIYGQLKKYTVGDFDYLVHFGSVSTNAVIAAGRYYLEVSDNSNVWFSEVVTYADFNPQDLSIGCPLVKITYWDSCDIDSIFYRTAALGDEQYKNVLYLDIDIGQPSYEITEEGQEDAEGKFVAEFRSVEKSYLLQGVFPEYIVDALSLLPLHLSESGSVEVNTHRGYTGAAQTISLEPAWQGTFKVWALTDLIFSTTFTRKVNCCTDGDTSGLSTKCVPNAIEVVAKVVKGSVDHANFQYTQEPNPPGGVVPFNSSELLIEQDSAGVNFLKIYNSRLRAYTNYPRPPAVGTAFIDTNQAKVVGGTVLTNNPHYFWAGGAEQLSQQAIIDYAGTDPGGYKVQGRAWNDSLVTLYALDGLTSIAVGYASGVDFRNVGIIVPSLPANATLLYVVAEGAGCTLGLSKGEKVIVGGGGFEGIGVAKVGSTLTVR